MADFETNRLQSITPEQLRREVLDPDEIAIVDVREGDRYASGHISVAVELPISEIELRAALLLPRGGAARIFPPGSSSNTRPRHRTFLPQ